MKIDFLNLESKELKMSLLAWIDALLLISFG